MTLIVQLPSPPITAKTQESLQDHPRVAAIDNGGLQGDPGRLTEPVKFRYEVVQGFFLQNGPKPKHLAFEDLLEKHFGLLDTSENRWLNLKRDIHQLQDEADKGTEYKVLFLGRHGQGWHNFVSRKYGAEAWDAHWTFITTDGTYTWGPDPDLTPLGESQAAAVHRTWAKEIKFGAPCTAHEMKWYLSPLMRTCQTMVGSFGDLLPGVEGRPGSPPEIWEDWREIYGSHTCDKRSTKSAIQKRFPDFKIEEGFTENDELWKADERESDQHMQMRGRRALDRMFDEGGAKETYISITSHSAFLRNLLAVLEHQPYWLATGEMVPVVVKAIRVQPPGNGDSA